jgi:hypothetical protein
MAQCSISVHVYKMKPLLDKHQNTDGISMETGMMEGDHVSSTREDPLNSNSRAYVRFGSCVTCSLHLLVNNTSKQIELGSNC